MTRISVFLLFVFAATAANADVEIHKCIDADGNVAYQQIPCPVEKAETEAPEVAEAIEETPQAAVVSNRSDTEIEACKDPLRDAIDAIEVEMLRGFSPQEGEEFKAKLRTLTQKMRACG